jgi:hypothetical protein
MRHLWSLVLSAVLGVVLYIAAGYATIKISNAVWTHSLRQAFAPGSSTWSNEAVWGVTAVLIAGAAYVILLRARISPVGPASVGLVLMGATLWALTDPRSFVANVPTSFMGTAGVLTAPPVDGTVILAIPLLLTIFSAENWESDHTETVVIPKSLDRLDEPHAAGTPAAPAYHLSGYTPTTFTPRVTPQSTPPTTPSDPTTS